MARNALNGQPSNYADEKLVSQRARWRSAAGDALRAFGPRVWPSTPLPALMGVTANSTGPAERYCSGFCAIGLYQTPEATWDQLRTGAAVRGLLDRDAAPSADFADAVPDQVAIGLVDLRNGLNAIVAQLPASLRPTGGSQWQLALGIMAYVVGAQAAARALAPLASQLAAAPEAQRFAALARLAAADGGHALVYPVTRTWQRLATGRALATAIGQDSTWYAVDAPTETQVALAQALYGPGGETGASRGEGRALIYAALVAGLVWYVSRRRH